MITASQSVIVMLINKTSRAAYLRGALAAAGYKVIEAKRGEDAMPVLALLKPQLILLDWNLSGLSPLEVICRIRSNANYSRLPLILTGMNLCSEDKILALEAGADICIDSAVYPRELAARVKALLRRTNYQNNRKGGVLTMV